MRFKVYKFAVIGHTIVATNIDTLQNYEMIIPDQQLHIGVSPNLADLTDTTPPDLGDAIRSYQFTIGDSPYCKKAFIRPV